MEKFDGLCAIGIHDPAIGPKSRSLLVCFFLGPGGMKLDLLVFSKKGESMKAVILFLSLWSSVSFAHLGPNLDPEFKGVISDLALLKAIGAPIQIRDESLQVGISFLNGEQRDRLSILNHQAGKCAGYELLSDSSGASLQTLQAELQILKDRHLMDRKYSEVSMRIFALEKNEEIQKAVDQASAESIEASVRWFSAFPNRYNAGQTPNAHVDAFKIKLEELMAKSKIPWKVEMISHRSTAQKSIRVSLAGKARPNEIIVLGGHYDSINQRGDRNRAPGADDNASGSANLFEALRILSQGSQPERTVEFYWYAGEESGLLGSKEIAREYKTAKKDVIAVLQLDMTAYAGEGELVIGNITDFTSPWLHDFFREANRLYIGARLVDDRCGYGCSDHASWYRQGYATLLPFESTSDSMNPKIHTTEDTVENKLNFKHARAFSQIALVFAMELGNSTMRQP